MLQHLFRSRRFIETAGNVMAWYVRLVERTSTVIEDPPDFIAKNVVDHPLIIAMWHGQGLLLPHLRPREDLKVAIMVAKHIDGDIVHAAVGKFGMTTVRGAGAGRKGKDKGGFKALRACMTALRNDTTVAITADIPPGPARKAGLGLPILSKLSGRAIMPCAVVTSRYFKLNTWSGFTVNLPFSKMVMAGGDQIRVPRRASETELEEFRRKLEDSLNEVTARAYRKAGAYERGEAGDGRPVAYGFFLNSYVRLTSLLQSAAPFLLRYRVRRGKEETARTGERLGMPTAARLPGPLVWLHAASVGESIAVFHLIEKLVQERPDLRILLTTGTTTSARLARARLPEGVIHQYVPLDTPDFMRRFFDHWRPGTVVLTESEIWPNLIREARTRQTPLILVNGRLSPRSFRRWRRRVRIARSLFSLLDLVLAQNDRYAGYFERLGARNVQVAGNLKMDAPPPPADEDALKRLRNAVGNRTVFLAASTHPGEEKVVAGVHEKLKRDFPDLLTVIVPRHPERGREISDLLMGKGFNCTLRTQHDAPRREHDIYVADTIGELGLFYALSPIAFVGGSLVPHGGQNPIEAVMHDCAILTGPKVQNFREAYDALKDAGGCVEVGSGDELAKKAHNLLKDKKARARLISSGRDAIADMRGALDATYEALMDYLPPPAKERKRAS